MYAIGVPLNHRETPPPEQKKCTIELCGNCNQKIWVSEKIDALREQVKENPVKAWCIDCIIEKTRGKVSEFSDLLKTKYTMIHLFDRLVCTICWIKLNSQNAAFHEHEYWDICLNCKDKVAWESPLA
jgi:hypothetical protein